MSRVWVVGFGKFGRLAIPKICSRWPQAQIWIVDRDPAHLTADPELPGVRVLQEGSDFLWEVRNLLDPRDWIIPAVPFHLAGDWMRRILVRRQPVRKIKPPATLGAGLPFSLYLRNDLYVSLADFECPENCPSPQGFCFRTREKRPFRLWELLAAQSPRQGFLQILQSRQLAPGLGGYRFEDLNNLETLARRIRFPFYLATACPCHGVITGFDRS